MEDDIADHPLEGPETGNLAMQDPADIAADLLIERALAEPGLREAVVAPGIAVIVEVPSGEWVEEIAESWRDSVRGGTDPVERRPRKLVTKSSTWRELRRDGASKSERSVGTDEVADALWQGIALVGFSPDTQLLPPDLVRSADHTFVLGPIDAEIINALALRLTGTVPTSTLDPSAYAALTPNVLRIACRPKQRADDFVARLKKLTARPKPPAMAVPTLDHLHGMDEAVEWGKSLGIDVVAYLNGDLDWSMVDRGALICGPPGTGKTTYARSLAATIGLPLIATSYAAWQSTKEGHLGDVIRTLRAVFDEARKQAPSILFIDELDTVGSRASDQKYDEWWRAIINALLEHLDGIASRQGVIVIAATNYPDKIDPAILRAGRLDRRISIDLPDPTALVKIFRVHLDGDLTGVDLSMAGVTAAGSTGADCEKWVRGAKRRARRANRDMILADLLDEIGGDDTSRSPAFTRRIAIHEAGHAVHIAVHRPGALVTVSVRAGETLEGGVREGWIEPRGGYRE